MKTPAESCRVDVRSVAITGLTTMAWYAVPDAVGPRWARALVKAGVLAGGLGLGLAVTTEGRSALDGMREMRGGLRDLRDTGADDAAADDAVDRGERDDNALAADLDLADADTLPHPVVAGAAAAGVLAVVVTVAVAGERWAYRRGERWRARGLRLPHTRVGLILGTLAAAATALDPSAARPDGPEGRPAA
ncbi:hypothetical protein [Krasilnikoviella flava]|uniref:Peptidase S9 n=1 Tax=Krasilnikoviella flava TaxID=526729 RepID=A0A1T5LI95_9MICO|nr:hypothetical protein [Krasilnikoviella flava]SKC75584.1 hypothetical protein SAMN04324258_3454 [Krasilnikoviella flava]